MQAWVLRCAPNWWGSRIRHTVSILEKSKSWMGGLAPSTRCCNHMRGCGTNPDCASSASAPVPSSRAAGGGGRPKQAGLWASQSSEPPWPCDAFLPIVKAVLFTLAEPSSHLRTWGCCSCSSCCAAKEGSAQYRPTCTRQRVQSTTICTLKLMSEKKEHWCSDTGGDSVEQRGTAF